MTRAEESGLIKRVTGGDADAFEPFVLEHGKKIYNLALRMLGNEHDAQDASQEAFLRAFGSLSSFRGDCKFSVWLYRLTTNICIDMIRSRDVTTVPIDGDEGDETPRAPEIPDTRYSPETEFEKKELRDAVRHGLERLSPEHRRILLLREISGLSYEEIGTALELEPGTVKSRIFRARQLLCGFLEETGNIPPRLPSKDTREV